MLLCMAGSLLLPSCYSHRQIGFMQDRKDLPHYEESSYQEYRLAVNDEVIYRLITLDETLASSIGNINSGASYTSQYANSYRIYQDSTIDIPFIGTIRIGGLTVREAQDTIEAVVREIIPDASVKLALYNKTFTVLGDIGSGTYRIYKERMNIFQALAMTGDVQNSGDRRHVRIIRPHGDQEPEVLEFDLRTNTIIDSQYYWVYPNDVIYVSRSKGSFFKVPTYTGFLGLITSSVSFLVTVINYYTNFK